MPWRAALVLQYGKLYLPAAALVVLGLWQLIWERDIDAMWKSFSEAGVLLGFAGIGGALVTNQEQTRALLEREKDAEHGKG